MTRPTPAFTPSAREGVAASRVAVVPGPWGTVLAFLQARLPAVADWPERLARGAVLDAAGAPLQARSPCRPGQLIWYWRQLAFEHRVPFEITLLHRCEHLLVIDKPHFLSVTPTGRYVQQTALVRLKRAAELSGDTGLQALTALHRLDRETAGVLAFALRAESRNAYHALWRERRVYKRYEAVVAAPAAALLPAFPLDLKHRLEELAGSAFMQMQVLPGEPNSHTTASLLGQRTAPGAAAAQRLLLLQLQPHTGRRHQLRAQLNAIGLPIIGDRIYPQLWPEIAADDPMQPPDYSAPLQLLARELAFDDPVTGQTRCFTSQRELAAWDASDVADRSA